MAFESDEALGTILRRIGDLSNSSRAHRSVNHPKAGSDGKELGKGMERKVALGMVSVKGPKEEVESLHCMTDDLAKAVDTNTSHVATPARTVKQFSK